jgi:hypothetical protein
MQKYPPYIPSTIPFLGHAVSFGKTPVEFLLTAYDRVSIHYTGVNWISTVY